MWIYIPGSSLGCVILVLSGKCASWKRGLNILAGGWTHISSYLGPIRLQKTFPPLRCTCQRSEGWAQIQPLGDMAKKVQDFRLENKSRMIQECQHVNTCLLWTGIHLKYFPCIWIHVPFFPARCHARALHFSLSLHHAGDPALFLRLGASGCSSLEQGLVDMI